MFVRAPIRRFEEWIMKRRKLTWLAVAGGILVNLAISASSVRAGVRNGFCETVDGGIEECCVRCWIIFCGCDVPDGDPEGPVTVTEEFVR